MYGLIFCYVLDEDEAQTYSIENAFILMRWGFSACYKFQSCSFFLTSVTLCLLYEKATDVSLDEFVARISTLCSFANALSWVHTYIDENST